MTAPPPFRVEALIHRMAMRRPGSTALIYGERRWTYARLYEEAVRRAVVLVESGLEPGSIVVSTESITDDLIITFLACCHADVTFLSLPSRLTERELMPLVASARPTKVLTRGGGPHPILATLPALPIDLPGHGNPIAESEARRRSAKGNVRAVAMLQATSGTTGSAPKLVIMSHEMLTWRWASLAWWETPETIYCIPRSHTFIVRYFPQIAAVGSAVILSDSAHPGRLEEEMAAHGATVLRTVPAILQMLTRHDRPIPEDLALRVVLVTSAPLNPALEDAVTLRYGKVIVVRGYGLTEGGTAITTPEIGGPPGSIGQPLPDTLVRIVDDGVDVPDGVTGELIVRSPGLMRGYLDDPEATARALRDGWLWTGDLARRDADGFYFLEGRRALRINVGGFKVAPEEVEAVLEQHPAVREAVVLAKADRGRGEVVRAVIVPEGAPPSVGELRRWCRERLAGYKVPRVWEFRDELPRSPLGKVLRHLL